MLGLCEGLIRLGSWASLSELLCMVEKEPVRARFVVNTCGELGIQEGQRG